MSETTIVCPKCCESIKLTETLAAPAIEDMRKRLLADLEQQKKRLVVEAQAEAERKYGLAVDAAQQALAKERATVQTLRQHELDIVRKERELEERRLTLELSLEQRMASERERIVLATRAEAVKNTEATIGALEKRLNEKDSKLREAQALELGLRVRTQALEEEKREFELAKQRQIDAERAQIRDAAKKEAEEQSRFAVAEKDKLLADARQQVEELKQRMSQGSQQLQGEIAEIDLEARLREQFPWDIIDPVPKGQRGADCIQRVCSRSGAAAGDIIWESKRTKTWNDGWLDKLRQDQHDAHAEVAVIVSAVLPKGVERFALVDGVFICDFSSALPLAMVLRQHLTEVATARRALVGQQGKMELLYGYLCSAEFRNRVMSIHEGIESMRETLFAEKRVMQKHWSAREKQIDRMSGSLAGMIGDLDGLGAKGVPTLEAFELPALAGADGV